LFKIFYIFYYVNDNCLESNTSGLVLTGYFIL